MSVHYLVTGCIIGIVFGMPIGALGALSMQRTMRYGVHAGLITGTASSVADMCYACVGAFGITLLSDFLIAHQVEIHRIGALLLMVLAIRMIGKKDIMTKRQNLDGTSCLSMFLSSFVIGVSNPAAIVSFLFAFSLFGIHGTLAMMDGIQLVIGVFSGTMIWWILLVAMVHRMKRKLNNGWYEKINIFFGVVLIMFSIIVLISTRS